ncbi:hypothetical protein BXZ70DRAFT_1006494 [Cristinia sonorae]|uniref:Uncharacterized protein n=1 Tax=Cristinia sonorae TaxID=1940300 RepID=A0A8K0USS1_9AGAR|nr:hypothetical protein BXZ70DRAFT_1006494 [Cristinia sonorae]
MAETQGKSNSAAKKKGRKPPISPRTKQRNKEEGNRKRQLTLQRKKEEKAARDAEAIEALSNRVAEFERNEDSEKEASRTLRSAQLQSLRERNLRATGGDHSVIIEKSGSTEEAAAEKQVKNVDHSESAEPADHLGPSPIKSIQATSHIDLTTPVKVRGKRISMSKPTATPKPKTPFKASRKSYSPGSLLAAFTASQKKAMMKELLKNAGGGDGNESEVEKPTPGPYDRDSADETSEVDIEDTRHGRGSLSESALGDEDSGDMYSNGDGDEEVTPKPKRKNVGLKKTTKTPGFDQTPVPHGKGKKLTSKDGAQLNAIGSGRLRERGKAKGDTMAMADHDIEMELEDGNSLAGETVGDRNKRKRQDDTSQSEGEHQPSKSRPKKKTNAAPNLVGHAGASNSGTKAKYAPSSRGGGLLKEGPAIALEGGPVVGKAGEVVEGRAGIGMDAPKNVTSESESNAGDVALNTKRGNTIRASIAVSHRAQAAGYGEKDVDQHPTAQTHGSPTSGVQVSDIITHTRPESQQKPARRGDSKAPEPDNLDDPFNFAGDDSAEAEYARSSPIKPVSPAPRGVRITRVVPNQPKVTRVPKNSANSEDSDGKPTKTSSGSEASAHHATQATQAKLMRKQDSLPPAIRNHPSFKAAFLPTYNYFIGCIPTPFLVPPVFGMTSMQLIFDTIFSPSSIREKINSDSAVWYNAESSLGNLRTEMGNVALELVYEHLVEEGLSTVDERTEYAALQRSDSRYIYQEAIGDNKSQWKSAYRNITILKTFARFLSATQGRIDLPTSLQRDLENAFTVKGIVLSERNLLLPRGALAMATAAVERAWVLYKDKKMSPETYIRRSAGNGRNAILIVDKHPRPIQDPTNKNGNQFSDANWGHIVTAKYKNLLKFSDSKIQEICALAQSYAKDRRRAAPVLPRTAASNSIFDIPDDNQSDDDIVESD